MTSCESVGSRSLVGAVPRDRFQSRADFTRQGIRRGGDGPGIGRPRLAGLQRRRLNGGVFGRERGLRPRAQRIGDEVGSLPKNRKRDAQRVGSRARSHSIAEHAPDPM
jgi:hypothetical protein